MTALAPLECRHPRLGQSLWRLGVMRPRCLHAHATPAGVLVCPAGRPGEVPLPSVASSPRAGGRTGSGRRAPLVCAPPPPPSPACVLRASWGLGVVPPPPDLESSGWLCVPPGGAVGWGLAPRQGGTSQAPAGARGAIGHSSTVLPCVPVRTLCTVGVRVLRTPTSFAAACVSPACVAVCVRACVRACVCVCVCVASLVHRQTDRQTDRQGHVRKAGERALPTEGRRGYLWGCTRRNTIIKFQVQMDVGKRRRREGKGGALRGSCGSQQS